MSGEEEADFNIKALFCRDRFIYLYIDYHIFLTTMGEWGQINCIRRGNSFIEKTYLTEFA